MSDQERSAREIELEDENRRMLATIVEQLERIATLNDKVDGYEDAIHGLAEKRGYDGKYPYLECIAKFGEEIEHFSDLWTACFEDGMRLDWLQEQHRGVEAGTMDDEHGEATRKLFVVDGAGADALMHDIRDAIDRAKERYPNPPISLPIGNDPFDERSGPVWHQDTDDIDEDDPTMEGWVA